MTEYCRKEVLELHTFFENWFTASIPENDETFARLEQALAPSFIMITPEASKVARKQLLENLRSMYGSYNQPEKPNKIWIKNLNPVQLADSLCLVTYEEWQGQNDQTDAKGRLSSALFNYEENSPNKVQWMHLHETWIT